MSQEQNEFEQLRRLLALKRHEQPPPGYFEHFSQSVIVRIRMEARHPASEESSPLGRFLNFWRTFEVKPAFAGAFGLAVCGLLVVGVVYSESTSVDSVALVPSSDAVSPIQVAGGTRLSMPALPASDGSGLRLSTIPYDRASLTGAGSLSPAFSPAQVEPVAFTHVGN
jgi:hypothetical protein